MQSIGAKEFNRTAINELIINKLRFFLARLLEGEQNADLQVSFEKTTLQGIVTQDNIKTELVYKFEFRVWE
jgi:hypothetical protein